MQLSLTILKQVKHIDGMEENQKTMKITLTRIEFMEAGTQLIRASHYYLEHY